MPHVEPITSVIFALAVILASAKLMGHLAVRLGLPAVLGELSAGIILGSAKYLGIGWFQDMEVNPTVDALASLGVIILMFEVGIESTVKDMLKVGYPSLRVAVLGVVAPFVLGWGVGVWLLPDQSPYVHVFLGAMLTATSVGITARVLKDMGESKSPEARVIMGAAVVDDVLGLVILSVVGGVIAAADQGGGFSLTDAGLVFGKAILFLSVIMALGLYFSPKVFSLASRLRGTGVLLATALIFCFVLAGLASAVGLAAIVGAYAAGLILEEAHFRGFVDRGEKDLEDLIRPISAFLVPVFFVLMGMHVDVRAFGRLEILGLAAILTLAAILGKQACSLGVLGQPIDRLSVGIGMIPRGEVGLIFANVGLGLTVAGQRIVDEGLYSAVVIMVILTTLITPPALKWSLARRDRRKAGA